MPDVKISQLPAAAALAGAEQLAGVQGGATVRMSAQDVANLSRFDATPLQTAIGALQAAITALQQEDATLHATDTATAGDVAALQNQTGHITTLIHQLGDLVMTHTATNLAIAQQGSVSKAECNQAMNALGIDRSKDAAFFIRDTQGAQRHHAFVVYRANGDVDELGTNYRFWFTMMDEAQ